VHRLLGKEGEGGIPDGAATRLESPRTRPRMVTALAVPAMTATVARPVEAAHPTRPGSLDRDGEVRPRSMAHAVGVLPDWVMCVWPARSGTATVWFEVHFDPFVWVVDAGLQ